MAERNWTAILVTHNSALHLAKNMECLSCQTVPAKRIVIVDSGSSDLTYLDPYRQDPRVVIREAKEDIGFCCGNNLALRDVPEDSPYLLFLNPDAFLSSTFSAQAIERMERPECADVAMLTGPLLGYDIAKDQPTGKYDSTGIFSTWYGRWYDRDQGCPVRQGLVLETLPAICGALMFCRREALEQVYLGEHELFDSSFYMYKEDIDLSLRLRAKGWRLLLDPELTAYHCRGWHRDRRQVSRRFRLLSARNELKIHLRRNPLKALYSLAKWCGVYAWDL